MLKVIVFDFDGTIMDTNAIIKDSLNEVAIKYRGRPLSDAEFDPILGRALHEQVAMINDRQEDLDNMVEAYRAYYRAHQKEKVHLFEGIRDCLDAIKDMRIPCAVFTNKGRNGLDNGLRDFDLGQYFQMTISAYDIENPKPHPQGLQVIAEHFGVKTEELLMIGDSAHDIEAGKAAGAQTALVSWTIIDQKKLKALNPDVYISQAMDLPQYIKSQQSI